MIINSSRNCVGSAVIYWITVAILIYSEHGISQQASLALIDSTTISSWSMLLSASVGNIKDSLATFGVRPDATSGYDSQYDIPRPPDPPGDYIKVYFPHAGSGWPSMLGTKYMSDLCSPKDPAWVFKVETSMQGSTVVLSWDTSEINKLPSDYRIMMIDSGGAVTVDLRTQEEYSFQYQAVRTFSVSVDFGVSFSSITAGWNLISIPRIVHDSSTSILFPSAISSAFAYENIYIPITKLENGKGYWLKFDSLQLIPIIGLELPSLTIPVVQGWNLIGSVDHNIPVPSGGIVTSNVFSYEGSGYVPVDTLKPGVGYWVKTSTSGSLELISSRYSAERRAVEQSQRLSVFTIGDQVGGKQMLFLSDEGYFATSFHELPPPPPDGVFDARFASNKYVERYNSGGQEPTIHRIKVQSSHYPISITASIPGSTIIFSLRELNGSTYGCTHQLYDGVTIKIEDPQVHELQIVASGKLNGHNQFFLKQNHPNPWNPSTIIEYGLPERALVRLSIYDILGKETFCLVDDIKEPGQYQLIVDGNKLGFNSGVYYYKCSVYGCETGLKYNNTKKFIFLK